jgi:hypothetical protein
MMPELGTKPERQTLIMCGGQVTGLTRPPCYSRERLGLTRVGRGLSTRSSMAAS